MPGTQRAFAPLFLLLTLALILAVLMAIRPAWADTSAADNAVRELQRQQEQQQQLQQRQEPSPQVRLQTTTPHVPGHIPTTESPCFTIHSIRLGGDASDRFQWALKAARHSPDGSADLHLPQCLGGVGINLIMRRIQNAIIAKGYVTTRVLAPAQDLKSGHLQLTLVPGRVRAIKLAKDADPDASIWNAFPIHPSDILNLRAMEQGLENLRRVPSVSADIDIVPATGRTAKPGQSDLVIHWNQKRSVRASLEVDDSGSRTTGKYLGNVTVSADDWLDLNDLFYFSVRRDLADNSGGGTRGHTLHYSFPFEYWQFALTSSANTYHQSVAGNTQTYTYSGESHTGELKISRLLFRDATRKFTLSLSGWTTSSRNFVDDVEAEIQHRRMAGWTLDAHHREYLGHSTLDLDLAYRHGTGARNALPAPEDLFGEGTARPRVFNADVNVDFPFNLGQQPLHLASEWRAQWNRTPLVPQDNFSIGGRYSVRGFDGETVLAADRGWLIRNDLGWWPAHWGQELYLGLDYGEVNGADTHVLPGTRLAGTVLGMRGAYHGLVYDLFAGSPLQKPNGFKTAAFTAGFTASYSF